METEGSGASRAGEDDFLNEDAYLVDEGLGLYVVCDGAGDRPAGEVASEVAVEALEDFVASAGRFGDPELDEAASRRLAASAIGYALGSVLRARRVDPEFSRMATTLTMLLVHGRHGVVSHVGDSRAYLIRDARIHQLTRDHELTEDLHNSESDDGSDTAAETFSADLEPGDIYLLCTDGAERVVEDPELMQIAQSMSPRTLASRIISAAHEKDPDQDATVVVVRVRGEDDPAWLWLSTTPRETAFGHAVAVYA